jgi:hypothetical protein
MLWGPFFAMVDLQIQNNAALFWKGVQQAALFCIFPTKPRVPIRNEMEEASPDEHPHTLDASKLDIKEIEKKRIHNTLESGLAYQVELTHFARRLQNLHEDI